MVHLLCVDLSEEDVWLKWYRESGFIWYQIDMKYIWK